MPQTGTTENHAHLYEIGGTRTSVTNNHWHRIFKGQQFTGPQIPVGQLKAEGPENRHELPTQ